MVRGIEANICRYMWYCFDDYSSEFVSQNGNPIIILESGELCENRGNIYINSSVQIDEVVYLGSVMMHNSIDSLNNFSRKYDVNNHTLIIHIVPVVSSRELPYVDSIYGHQIVFVTIPEILLQKYLAITGCNGAICGEYYQKMLPFSKVSIMDTLMVRRMENKVRLLWRVYVSRNKNIIDTMLFSIFDSINIASKNRRLLGTLLDNIQYYSIIQRIDNIDDMEALLFGCAGLLDNLEYFDDYSLNQRNRFAKLQRNYQLQKVNPFYWAKYTKSSESIYTVLAQLAAILMEVNSMLTAIVERTSLEDLYDIFSKELSPYWKTNIAFGVSEDDSRSSKISKSKIEIIIINGILPFMMLYYKLNENSTSYDGETILDYYAAIPAEKNHIVTLWKGYGMEVPSALESQAIIELHKNFCKEKACYHCPIGRKMLSK